MSGVGRRPVYLRDNGGNSVAFGFALLVVSSKGDARMMATYLNAMF